MCTSKLLTMFELDESDQKYSELNRKIKRYNVILSVFWIFFIGMILFLIFLVL